MSRPRRRAPSAAMLLPVVPVAACVRDTETVVVSGSSSVRKLLKPALEILVGIPSVVLGFFALTFISPEVVQRVSPSATQFDIAAAGIGVGILAVPLIASVSEDAMRAVPRALREASYGLGARKITTTIRVVIPAAVSGLVAAIHRRRVPGDRRDHGRVHRRRRHRWFAVQHRPHQAGQTMTAAIASQAAGTDQVRGAGLVAIPLRNHYEKKRG